LSGDVHQAEFLKDDCTAHIHGYPLKEFVSSGLTHGLSEAPVVGPLIKQVVELLTPKTYDDPLNARGLYNSRFMDNNFGIVDFYFSNNGEPDHVVWSIRGRGGQTIYQKLLTEEFFDK
jgi:outer membrane PBP1 activator LpoA protein